jgi:hypothetical protein
MTYRVDESGLAALARSQGMSDAMVAAAEAGKTAAEAKAREFAVTGDYADSFEVEAVEVKAGRKNEPRAGALLKNTSDHSTAVEWGTSTREGRHVLRDVIPVIEKGGE